jgi:hypothetical protein
MNNLDFTRVVNRYGGKSKIGLLAPVFGFYPIEVKT